MGRDKKNILLYLKNELYLFADMVHQNEKILNTIKDLFPVEALLKNLKYHELDIVARTGLARIMISLFMNTERLLLVKKPKTQRVLGDDQVAGLRLPTYITSEQLREIKDMINKYFMEKDTKDLSLHYEYLRLLSYLLNSDFLLGKAETKEQWREELASAYGLLENVFLFCMNQLRMIPDPRDSAGGRRRTTTGNLAQIHDEAEDVPIINANKGFITEEQLEEARIISAK
ncbi:MAG: hypothetical protein P4M11_02660 [Candidatus Pacebacteria bacterium]|nr:hypothetical protein [Candidatus Paceibacterota bacterium]